MVYQNDLKILVLQTMFMIAAGLLALSVVVFILPAYSQCDTTDGLCAHRPHVVIEMISPVVILGTVVGGAALLLLRIASSPQN